MTRIWRLGVLGIMALVEVALVVATYSNPFQPVRAMGFDYYLFFFLCLGAMAQAAIAANWLLERRLLGTFGLAVGDFHPPTGRYIFRDKDGSHRGGTVTPAACHHEDNTCLVFYAPEHPDSNVPSFRLLFHKLVLR